MSTTEGDGFPDLAALAAHAGTDVSVLELAVMHRNNSPDFPFLGWADEHRPVSVYLDLFHWVALAKAKLGRSAVPEDLVAYEYLRQAAREGEIIVTLCAATYMEIARIGSVRQRKDLADVIGEISGFVTLLDATIAIDQQLETALAARLDRAPPATLQPFGLGVGFAFGKVGGVRLGPPETLDAIDDGTIREFEAMASAAMEYMLLRGPAPEELTKLRAAGYRPEAYLEVEDERLRREQDLATRLANDPKLKRLLGDVVAARQLYWGVADRLPGALRAYGLTVDDFFANGKEWITGFLNDIPSAGVRMLLHDKNFRNEYKKWTGNDIRDIDAMSEAVPYCDVVLADKHVVAQLRRSEIVRRQGTHVFAKLGELVDFLRQRSGS
jgi:hypothetical protein